MIRRDGGVGGGVLAWEARGTVTREDVREFQEELRREAPEGGSARVLVDVAAMSDADLDAVWQDARHSLEYVRRIDRLAVIGDARWERWLTRLADTAPGLTARYFTPEQGLEARSWLGAG